MGNSYTVESKFLLADNPQPEKYLGEWYEVARKSFSYEPFNSYNITAEYQMNEDGTLRVTNSYYLNGVKKSSVGKAFPKNGNWSHLRVSFFLGAWSDYRIILLDENYRYSVVSNEDDSQIWILSRTKHLNNLQDIINQLVSFGIKNDFIFCSQI